MKAGRLGIFLPKMYDAVYQGRFSESSVSWEQKEFFSSNRVIFVENGTRKKPWLVDSRCTARMAPTAQVRV
jgi:hypothetical protein